MVYSGNVSQTYSYTYDALGNILTYTAPGKAAFTYTYDNQGQLTKATNGTTTYNYTYDTVGNITAANGHSYTYGNSNWRDLLTAFDGQSITYDGSGNPTSYYNGTRWTFTWKNGRELATASAGSTSISYAYDLGGLRTAKNVGGTVHNYIYASGKLLRETYGSNTLDFFYDNNGTPFALKHNGTLYYYVTNLQGDVMNLVDGSGNVVATYDYDPYGKVITSTGTLAEINPLRYRGYYYDTESGLYYLQSRYYDPAIGRFINADSYASTGQGIIGNNMFAYCLNDPVNRIDIGGAASIWYYLMVDHDMGYVHRMVQLHIRANYRNISTEWILTGFGRADVVDTTLGVVWEVKHAAKIPEARTIEATAQALSYVGGKHGGTTITGLGKPHAFEGQFHITIEGNLYQVDYETRAAGVILYTVKEVRNNPNEATANAYAHAYTYSPKNKKERTGAVMLGTLVLGLGGGSSKFCFSKDYQGYGLALGG